MLSSSCKVAVVELKVYGTRGAHDHVFRKDESAEIPTYKTRLEALSRTAENWRRAARLFQGSTSPKVESKIAFGQA